MKGIAHFLTGVALATCLPDVVPLAQEGVFLPVLGGIMGLLPDLLDFRLVRYLERYDVEVDPDPVLLNASGGLDDQEEAAVLTETAAYRGAAYVVDAFVDTMREAYAGQPRRLVAHTVRRGADLWRQYSIRIDPEAQCVAACIGPLVTTSQVPIARSTSPEPIWVERPLDFPIRHDYQRVYHVDIFTGPSFYFIRESEDLMIHFLDWHHRWTHSLVLAIVLGIGVGVIGQWAWGSAIGRLAGLVSGLAFAAHALEDQLGHMGCNLLWPLTRRRQPGLGMLHASDAAPNFLTTWTALALILYNLHRASAIEIATSQRISLTLVMLGVMPWVLYAAWILYRRLRHPAPTGQMGAGDTTEADIERLAESHAGEVR